jgi:hypothetical protein
MMDDIDRDSCDHIKRLLEAKLESESAKNHERGLSQQWRIANAKCTDPTWLLQLQHEYGPKVEVKISWGWDKEVKR